jgi:hypothetical protein
LGEVTRIWDNMGGTPVFIVVRCIAANRAAGTVYESIIIIIIMRAESTQVLSRHDWCPGTVGGRLIIDCSNHLNLQHFRL